MNRPGVKNKNDLRNHPFFATIDWKKLEAKEVIPPYLEPLNEEDIEMPVVRNIIILLVIVFLEWVCSVYGC